MGLPMKQQVASMPPELKQQWLEDLDDQEAYDLLNSWVWIARPEQLEPEGDWHCWLILAGRGWGKTRTASEFIVHRVMNDPRERVALIGRSAADTRDVMIEEPASGILAVAAMRGIQAEYEPSKRRVTFGNGAVAIAYSAEEPNLLRGPQHSLGWLDELAMFTSGQEHGSAYENFLMGLRRGSKPQYIVTTTPRPVPVIRSLVSKPSTHVTTGTTYDNADNLPDTFLERITEQWEGTRRGRQELYGEILEDVDGAYWNQSLFKHGTRDETYERIVLAIDPATTVGENSDYTAITVAGKTHPQTGVPHSFHVLHSEQLKATPNEWAQRVNELFSLYNVDRIVAERNQGGLMVESTMRNTNPDLPITTVHAKQGKRSRAEPIVALYEQGRVNHAGDCVALEEQMCLFPTKAAEHDDLVDSLVYALTELSDIKPTKQPSPLYCF